MGSGISISSSGSFSRTEAKLRKLQRDTAILSILNRYGQEGVNALSRATPVDSGETAANWGFQVTNSNGVYGISWTNRHVNEGVHIAIILQYGHGTGTGGWVEGRDYINPAIRPIFDQIKAQVHKEVTSA